MKILVTGGAGYIGSTLVLMLLEAGHAVRVLDNLRYGQHSALVTCARYPGFEFVRGDACEIDELSWPDVILPLAAMVGAPLCDLYGREGFHVNFKAIETIINNISKDQLIIYPNTNSGYGVTGDVPATEDTPLNPISQYGRWKCCAENVVVNHPNSIVLRLATVYGMSPRMRLDLLVNDFVRRAINDHSLVLYEAYHRRSIVHVVDVARVFMHVIEAYSAGSSSIAWATLSVAGKIFNVAAENLTKLDLALAIQRQVPNLIIVEAAAGHDPDQRDYAVSSERLSSTGFWFTNRLSNGITELIKGLSMIPQSQYGNV